MASILSQTAQIQGTLTVEGSLDATLSAEASISAVISLPEVVYPNSYEGDYEITPTTETQELETEGLVATANIVINPIPSNYGLITWDGSTLTVS